jgi:hypothetical protein
MDEIDHFWRSPDLRTTFSQIKSVNGISRLRNYKSNGILADILARFNSIPKKGLVWISASGLDFRGL